MSLVQILLGDRSAPEKVEILFWNFCYSISLLPEPSARPGNQGRPLLILVEGTLYLIKRSGKPRSFTSFHKAISTCKATSVFEIPSMSLYQHLRGSPSGRQERLLYDNLTQAGNLSLYHPLSKQHVPPTLACTLSITSPTSHSVLLFRVFKKNPISPICSRQNLPNTT